MWRDLHQKRIRTPAWAARPYRCASSSSTSHWEQLGKTRHTWGLTIYDLSWNLERIGRSGAMCFHPSTQLEACWKCTCGYWLRETSKSWTSLCLLSELFAISQGLSMAPEKFLHGSCHPACLRWDTPFLDSGSVRLTLASVQTSQTLGGCTWQVDAIMCCSVIECRKTQSDRKSRGGKCTRSKEAWFREDPQDGKPKSRMPKLEMEILRLSLQRNHWTNESTPADAQCSCTATLLTLVREA